MPMFIAALLTIAKRQVDCPLTDKWLTKIWYIYAMEYYPVLKRKEIRIHAAVCMTLEDTVLSEISQSLKDKYCLTPLL